MTTTDFDTLIIGAGFAGTSVAHALGGDGVAVLDRGEVFDLARAYGSMKFAAREYREGHFDSLVDSEAQVMKSDLPENQLQLPLSFLTSNAYTYVQGGISNWWGGYSARITRATFEQRGELTWPIGYDEIEPYYRAAEHLLHVHGDPTVSDYSVFGAMPGWDYWRAYFADLFPAARVTPEAKNLTNRDAQVFGLCLGNGHCAICGNDAKARPAVAFPNVDVYGNTLVEQIVFDGNRAVGVKALTNGEHIEISAKRIVVASGGLENVALLKRSALPSSVAVDKIGGKYQDHTTCEVLGTLPKPFRHFHLGSEGAIEIPELSGYFHGIEVKTLMIPVPPTPAQTVSVAHGGGAAAVGVTQLRLSLPRTGRFYLQMEIPPEWGLRLRTKAQQAFLYTMPYLHHRPILDAVVLEVLKRMTQAGITVTKITPHHQSGFGGHHYSGTTAMSQGENAVLDQHQLLMGTENVYLNGGSVIPRCGGAGPTLTIVALGLRLGAWLAAQDKH